MTARARWLRISPSAVSLLATLLAAGPRAEAAPPAGPSLLPAAPARGVPLTAEAGLKVDEIQLSGVTVFTTPEIEAVLEVSPGDRLERLKVQRTAEALQNLYRLRGYERVAIEGRLFRQKATDGAIQSVLQFSVKEGLPTRVASVRIVPERPEALDRGDRGSRSFERYWRRLEPALLAKLGVAAGDILDQQKLTSGRRAAQDVLAAEEYVGARIEDVRIAETPAPAHSPADPAQAPPEAARWVAVELRADLGDRVTFGFRGNAVFPAYRLSTLIEEQRLLGLGKDYIDAIRRRIEELYHELGYAKARAKPYTFERPSRQERHVTYVIDEGPRVRLGPVVFDGNSVFTQEELRSQFVAKAGPVVQGGYYVEKDIQKAAELVVEWMKSKGYLSAKLVTIHSDSPGADRPRGIVLYLYEGDRTIVQGVGLEGVSVFTPEEVRQRLGIRAGEGLNLFDLNEGLELLKADYRAKGYLSARITNENTDRLVRYSQENRLADITLEVDEGPQYRVSRIQLEGLSRTKEAVLLRELQFGEGGVLGERDIIESEAKLRRLGIFSSVGIRVQEDTAREGHKVVRIAVEEGTPGVVASGVGFRNDLGVRIFGQIGYANLWGRNHTLSLNSTFNRRLEDFRIIEGQAQVAYLWPWFLTDELTFRPTFTVSSFQYIKFSATTVSLAATWERRLLRSPNITGSLSYGVERINQFEAVQEFDRQDIRIGAITPALQLDLRDNPLSPSSGFFSSASVELATPWLLSQRLPYPISYYRFQNRNDFYLPLFNSVVWYFSLRFGYEQSLEARREDVDIRSGSIPSIKTFSFGGPGSMRGFKEQQINLYDYAVGAATYTNARTQLDFPLTGALNFGPFLDAANLHTDAFSLGTRYGAGVGFHYQTPVGPVNLDWGFNLNPQPGEDTWRFHFSIGVI